MEAMPNVYDYLDFRQFLRDYYAFRKKRKKSFSYQTWADELVFNDRSLLRMILSGRRNLSDKNKSLFLEKMPFDDLQALYFSHLVAMNNSTEPEKKHFHLARLMGILKVRGERVNHEPLPGVHSDPQLLAFYILLGYEDISKDTASLAARMNVTVEQGEKWLNTLSSLSLIDYRPDENRWSIKSQSFKVPDGPGNVTIKDFHRKSLEHAQACLSLDVEIRKFRSLILPLNPGQLGHIWKKFNEFALEMVADLEGQKMAERQLYQINFNCVPVTAKTNKESSCETLL